MITDESCTNLDVHL